MLFDVKLWWSFLGVISFINIGLLIFSAILFSRRKAFIDPEIYMGRKVILWLSGIYTLGCAFRSFLPRIDLERICLVDSWFSSMVVGRSVATIAEVAFIVQCAILLYEVGKGANNRFSVIIAQILIPLILIAEGFSWYAVISTDYLGSVVEESLWTIAGILLIISFISLWRHVQGVQQYFLAGMIVFAVGFVVFMVTVDVPMYWSRWQADTAAGMEYLKLKNGILDAAKDCTVNFDWNVWKEEIPWMTLYFTIAVWVSLYLTHAPGFRTFGALQSKIENK